ncbi:hypothetical protein [Phaeobacter sp. J2-8]|nr:hypothetical protein [Phaeobacter sp. J2-8]MCJ7871043.1 hypothetical protein [Phaeobacter sp. J2-8]
MKKFALAAAAAVTLASAAPAVAEPADVAADPFIATQGDTTALAILGGVTVLVLIAAGGGNGGSSSTSSSTGTP